MGNKKLEGKDHFMKIIGQVSLAFAVRLFNDFLLIMNVLVLLTMPFFLPAFYATFNSILLMSETYEFLLLFLYIAGTFTIPVLLSGHGILRSLEKSLPFDPKNPRRFVVLAISFLFLSVIFFVKLFTFATIMTFLGGFLFLLLTLLSLILAEVFRQACKIWEEHQLTI